VGGLLNSLSARRGVGLLSDQAAGFSDSVAAIVDVDDVDEVQAADDRECR